MNASGMSDAQVYEMADRLRGTDAVETDEAVVDDLLVVGQVARCPLCGYWWDSMEMNGDGACPDCAPE